MKLRIHPVWIGHQVIFRGSSACAADFTRQHIVEVFNSDPPFTLEEAKEFFAQAKDQAKNLREGAEGCAEAVRKLDDILGMRPVDMLTTSNTIRREAQKWFDMTQQRVFDLVTDQPEPDTPAVRDFYRITYRRMSQLLGECSKIYELAWNMAIDIEAKRARNS